LLLARRVGRGLRWSQCKFFPLLRRCKRVVSVPAPLRKGGTPCHPWWMFWLRCCWWRHLLVLVAGPSGGGGGSPFPSFPCSVGDRFSFNVLIRLDGCSGRWLLWRFQGLEPICRTGGGLLLAPMHVGVGGGRERGHRKKEVDLVVILLSFRVRDAKWGCTVHCY
jgi:hypothetical protein